MGMRMLHRIRCRLAELCRRMRRLWAIWQRRDPSAWVVALVGMALGLGLFLMTLLWLRALRLVTCVVKLLR